MIQRLETYPYPLAQPAWLFRQADGLADKVEKGGHFIELTATTLGVLALAWCDAYSKEPGGVRNWHKKLGSGGITLDTWNQAIRAASKEMESSPNDPIAQALRGVIKSTVKTLETYRPIRNTHAHGGKPRLRPDQQAAAEDLRKSVDLLLDRIDPLKNLCIGLVRSCRPRGSAFRAEVEIMMGFAEPFGVHRFSTSHDYTAGTLIAFNKGTLDHTVDLSPFCIWERCPQCGQEELFYLHQRRKEQFFYFSFSTGHELKEKGDKIRRASQPKVALGMTSLGSVRSAAASGWRAAWADLAPKCRRLAARFLDTVAASLIAGLGWVLLQLGLSTWPSVGFALLLLCLYEPIAVLAHGSLGKRLVHIEPISTWDSRPLNTGTRFAGPSSSTFNCCFPRSLFETWLGFSGTRRGSACMIVRRIQSLSQGGKSRPSGSNQLNHSGFLQSGYLEQPIKGFPEELCRAKTVEYPHLPQMRRFTRCPPPTIPIKRTTGCLP